MSKIESSLLNTASIIVYVFTLTYLKRSMCASMCLKPDSDQSMPKQEMNGLIRVSLPFKLCQLSSITGMIKSGFN